MGEQSGKKLEQRTVHRSDGTTFQQGFWVGKGKGAQGVASRPATQPAVAASSGKETTGGSVFTEHEEASFGKFCPGWVRNEIQGDVFYVQPAKFLADGRKMQGMFRKEADGSFTVSTSTYTPTTRRGVVTRTDRQVRTKENLTFLEAVSAAKSLERSSGLPTSPTLNRKPGTTSKWRG